MIVRLRAIGGGVARRTPEAAIRAGGAGEPLAIRIAERLLDKNSSIALRQAEAVRDRYWRAGNIIQTDLFVAVCSIIRSRDAVAARLATPKEIER